MKNLLQPGGVGCTACSYNSATPVLLCGFAHPSSYPCSTGLGGEGYLISSDAGLRCLDSRTQTTVIMAPRIVATAPSTGPNHFQGSLFCFELSCVFELFGSAAVPDSLTVGRLGSFGLGEDVGISQGLVGEHGNFLIEHQFSQKLVGF